MPTLDELQAIAEAGDGTPGRPQFVSDTHLRVGATDFHCALQGPAPVGWLHLMKSRALVEQYLDLVASLGSGARRIVEIGIYRGGSTPFIAEVFRPERLVALEISEDPVPDLSGFIAARGLHDVIRPHYGVDQGDRARVADIMASEFGGEPLDLVIDDASHRYEPTLASFETIFPLVRPGGLFVIEDWHGLHRMADKMAASLRQPGEDSLAKDLVEALRRGDQPDTPPVPLSQLILELVLVRTTEGEAVDSMTIDGDWVAIRRGPAELDPATFRLTDLYEDHFKQLLRA